MLCRLLKRSNFVICLKVLKSNVVCKYAESNKKLLKKSLLVYEPYFRLSPPLHVSLLRLSAIYTPTVGTHVFNWSRVAITPERNSRNKSTMTMTRMTTMTCNVTQCRRSRIVLKFSRIASSPFLAPPEALIMDRGNTRLIICMQDWKSSFGKHFPQMDFYINCKFHQI